MYIHIIEIILKILYIGTVANSSVDELGVENMIYLINKLTPYFLYRTYL